MSERKENFYDVIIIGGGPAGLTAGIYTSRAMLKTLIISSPTLPSQVLLTDKIENYPGFPNGISGSELLELMKSQTIKFGCEHITEEVKKISQPHISKFEIFFSNTDEPVSSKTVIIATGRRAKMLNIENEEQFVGRGISYCGICDAPLYRDKTVVVVGGGDTALQETLYIAKFVNKIYLVHRRKEFRGTKILQQQVFQNKKIEIVTPAVVQKIIGSQKVESVEIKFVDSGETRTICCDGIFVFIGEIPNTEFVKDILELDSEGYIVVNEKLCSSLLGIFAAGDCRKGNLKQVVTACSDGAVAAESVKEYLSK